MSGNFKRNHTNVQILASPANHVSAERSRIENFLKTVYNSQLVKWQVDEEFKLPVVLNRNLFFACEETSDLCKNFGKIGLCGFRCIFESARYAKRFHFCTISFWLRPRWMECRQLFWKKRSLNIWTNRKKMQFLINQANEVFVVRNGKQSLAHD